MLDDPCQGTGIGEIAMVQNEVTTTGVWVLVEMINSIGVINPANKTLNYDIKSLYCEHGKNRYQATL